MFQKMIQKTIQRTPKDRKEQEAAKDEDLGLRGHDDGNFGRSHRAIKREYLFVE